jgi:hypothetical protein
MWSEASQALALPPLTAQRRHVGLDRSLVDEDEALRIETILPRSPAPTPASDVVARLLKREEGFLNER